MITSKNIFYHELIGLELKIINSSNKSLIGISGIIVNETKKTFLVELKDFAHNLKSDKLFCEKSLIEKDIGNHVSKREVLIQKDVSIFQFKVPDGIIVEIDGKILLNRPEDRIKKRYKKI